MRVFHEPPQLKPTAIRGFVKPVYLLVTKLTRCRHKYLNMVRNNSIPRQFTVINSMRFNNDSQIITNNTVRHNSFLTRHNLQLFLYRNQNNTLNHNRRVHNSKYHKHVNRSKVKEKNPKKQKMLWIWTPMMKMGWRS